MESGAIYMSKNEFNQKFDFEKENFVKSLQEILLDYGRMILHDTKKYSFSTNMLSILISWIVKKIKL